MRARSLAPSLLFFHSICLFAANSFRSFKENKNTTHSNVKCLKCIRIARTHHVCRCDTMAHQHTVASNREKKMSICMCSVTTSDHGVCIKLHRISTVHLTSSSWTLCICAFCWRIFFVVVVSFLYSFILSSLPSVHSYCNIYTLFFRLLLFFLSSSFYSLFFISISKKK